MFCIAKFNERIIIESMELKSDRWIREMALQHDMIKPFMDRIHKDVISYGLSSYGYDIRIANEFKVFEPEFSDLKVIDPKRIERKTMIDFQGNFCIIPPHSFILGRSLEYIRMPKNVLGTVWVKSTYLRCGIVANFSPLEPEWYGYITIQVCNMTPLPGKVYSNEGIAQVVFFEGDEICEVSYADKKGKYQRQDDVGYHHREAWSAEPPLFACEKGFRRATPACGKERGLRNLEP